MEGHLLMSAKERERKVVLQNIIEQRLSLKEGGVKLSLSYRQMKRVYKRYRKEGDAGLIHLNRGKSPNNTKSLAFRQAVLSFYQQRLLDFGPTLACEKLAKQGLVFHHETLRRWLITENLWQRHPRHQHQRRLRPRRQRFGELVQMDGVVDLWFAHRKYCLMSMVDDATSTCLAILVDAESTASAMQLLWLWIEHYGIPQALYTDKHTIYRVPTTATIAEQLNAHPDASEFGKACHKLGINMIFAHSPQAKGRVERFHQIYQDRFVKELQFHNITSLQAANNFLKTTFCPDINRRFSKLPLNPIDAHRPLPKHLVLKDVFAFDYQRTLTNDYTLSFNSQCFQILVPKNSSLKPKHTLTVRLRLDNSMAILFNHQSLPFKLVSKSLSPKTQPEPILKSRPKPKSPSPNHPWRTWRPNYLSNNSICVT